MLREGIFLEIVWHLLIYAFLVIMKFKDVYREKCERRGTTHLLFADLEKQVGFS